MYLILGIVLGIFLLISLGMLVLLVKKPYIFISIVIALFALYEFYAYQFHLDFLPDGMWIWKQLYAKEKAWGIGMPGDNETGLIMFELPNSASEKTMKDGIDYLKTLKPGKTCSDDWQETPYLTQKDWFGEQKQDSDIPNVENYLNRYGFGIPFNRRIINEINQSIAMPGSYISYCRGGGAVIVMPKINRIALAYSG